MDASKLRSLPPAKRFSAMHRSRDKENMDTPSNSNSTSTSPSHLPLPAKKRKESRHFSTPPEDPLAPIGLTTTTTTSYCLPAKKRVWAFRPEFEFTPLSPIDLNVEYKPPLGHPPPPPRPCADDEATRADPKIIRGKDQDRGVVKKECSASVCSVDEDAREFAPREDEITEGEDKNDATANDDDDGIICAICQSTDGDPKDPIVFCDGCDLMVHTSCYGSPLTQGIPEGDWFCNQCLAAPKGRNADTFLCCLCPTKGGALKSTADGRWAHVVCALFVPEVFFHDSEGRDGIDCSKVPARRWDRRCYVCEGTSGCALDCSEPKCPLSFHVTCGLKEDLCIEYKEGKGKGAVVAGFCKRHTELWEKQQQTGKFKIVAREEQQYSIPRGPKFNAMMT
ncbi:peregrin [Punica granatum]|uniref:Uncharacterized protein n=2 Tax=Punica granatum TaxID=22663 RepID=A0A218X9V0_PUNGR|nr:peregrin [Punica granatum]OWM81479.1 hypothetical protein CDL15_Pgr007517 [Punica granatum]PKI60054.1 hypothetical protein CRG98_019539 [Punica granatum]